ncbi:hypothetical protein PRV_01065 [Mycoplasma parvum str. Indiana]|uniref:Uncharacterized protein n=1 Tax=Mycoplasma parvum str. Indiana TaxID=1403316 RepID=U5NC39_9MOLU|nr:hypothetical protein PRV_01065 [Mycoplasma parvum str. Indiana]
MAFFGTSINSNLNNWGNKREVLIKKKKWI